MRRVQGFAAFLCKRWLGLICWSACLVCFSQAPPNDDFTNAIPLYGNSVTFSGTVANATYETGEDRTACYHLFDSAFYGSVWWSWTATNSTAVVIDAIQTALPYPIGFSAGDTRKVDVVNEFDCCFMDSLTNRYICFNAIAGTNYHIRALGQGSSFTLRLTATNGPVIFRQPQSLTINEYESAMFGVLAGGFQPLKYQWRFNGNDLPGETAQALVMRNLPKSAGGEYSVILSNVSGVATSAVANLDFTAYTNQPIWLRAEHSQNPSLFQFSLSGESGRVYRVEVSDNLTNWYGEPALPQTVQNTNTTSVYSFEIYETPKFLRAYLFMNKEICIAHLKAIELAIKTWAIESKKSVDAAVSFEDIAPYLKTNPPTFVCPSGGVTFDDSYEITTAGGLPYCKKDPVHHVLPPEP